jgi:hypothetical protein
MDDSKLDEMRSPLASRRLKARRRLPTVETSAPSRRAIPVLVA